MKSLFENIPNIPGREYILCCINGAAFTGSCERVADKSRHECIDKTLFLKFAYQGKSIDAELKEFGYQGGRMFRQLVLADMKVLNFEEFIPSDINRKGEWHALRHALRIFF